ncbi:MAG TPA: polyprenol monophosphomannose synthase [Vicinamibacterales bacterium]|jgi:dolichol-phosphate mannosyltransferase
MRPLVIVPTYDERANLPLLLEQLLALPGLRILIVDDASPDGTGQVADQYAAANRARIQVLHRTGRRGLGLSYIDGMYVALRTDATHICQMDADLSHNPADIPRLLDAAQEADFVIGSRYVPGGRIENWPLHRRMLSAFANHYIRAITRLTIRDCTSGFRCWHREALEQLPLASIRSDGYAFIVELAWEASRVGLRCAEVPITFVERREGASKLSGMVIVESAIVPWRLAARPK